MTLRFRLARGVAVVIAIVVAHFVIVWLFQTMRLPAPDLGPVFATILVDPGTEAENAKRTEEPATAPASPAPPAAAQPAQQPARKAAPNAERVKPATPTDVAPPQR
jgi:type IV secretory pathway VirB10-like protein